jgi:hypothetical protein
VCATGRLFHRVSGHLHAVGGKFQADQVAAGKQCVAIPLMVDAVSWHWSGRPPWLIRRFRLGHLGVLNSATARTQLTWQPGGARVAQRRPDNRLAALAAAGARSTRMPFTQESTRTKVGQATTLCHTAAKSTRDGLHQHGFVGLTERECHASRPLCFARAVPRLRSAGTQLRAGWAPSPRMFPTGASPDVARHTGSGRAGRAHLRVPDATIRRSDRVDT